MSESGNIVDWRKLREFADVDLTRSFVLFWHVESDTLLVDIDLFLTPDHPFYEKPRPAEKVCIRPAVIEFPYCESLEADGQTVILVPPLVLETPQTFGSAHDQVQVAVLVEIQRHQRSDLCRRPIDRQELKLLAGLLAHHGDTGVTTHGQIGATIVIGIESGQGGEPGRGP